MDGAGANAAMPGPNPDYLLVLQGSPLPARRSMFGSMPALRLYTLNRLNDAKDFE